MNTRITLWVAISLLFVVALFLTFKAGAAGNVGAVQAVTGAATSAASASYGGMVGGC
ncbi:hypothetical protein J4443_03155 [Candidatus Woesearchaeota archaeon]|nr:hypothetical protein [Candidatus Woesearchaeota archaeon]